MEVRFQRCSFRRHPTTAPPAQKRVNLTKSSSYLSSLTRNSAQAKPQRAQTPRDCSWSRARSRGHLFGHVAGHVEGQRVTWGVTDRCRRGFAPQTERAHDGSRDGHAKGHRVTW
eukprot:1618758-Rhodomonas_salina.1